MICSVLDCKDRARYLVDVAFDERGTLPPICHYIRLALCGTHAARPAEPYPARVWRGRIS